MAGEERDRSTKKGLTTIVKERTETETKDDKKKDADKKVRQEAAKLEKAAKEAKKKERLEARQAGAKKDTTGAKDPNDPCASKFGDMEIIRS